MIKKLIPILLTLSIFTIFQIGSTFYKENKNNIKSVPRDNASHIENDVSKYPIQPINDKFLLYKNKEIIPNKYNLHNNTENNKIQEITQEDNYNPGVNQENINNISISSNEEISKEIELTNNLDTNQSTSNIDIPIINVENVNTTLQNKNINTLQYLNNLKYINYQLKSGETLTDIARRYENNCNLNTTIKLITSINKLDNRNDIDSGTLLAIPEDTLKNGIMYTIISGDTWYKIRNEYYYQYDADSIMNFLVYINDLPNNDLPLGERIFLPSI